MIDHRGRSVVVLGGLFVMILLTAGLRWVAETKAYAREFAGDYAARPTRRPEEASARVGRGLSCEVV
jgi:hypothetical protein